MGVRASRCDYAWSSFNVSVDLNYFNNIIPCGIQNKGVTSLESVLNKSVNMVDVEGLFISAFKNVFNITLKNSCEAI